MHPSAKHCSTCSLSRSCHPCPSLLAALVDKLLGAEALFARTWDGETPTLEAARERIRKRLLEMAARRPSK